MRRAIGVQHRGLRGAVLVHRGGLDLVADLLVHSLVHDLALGLVFGFALLVVLGLVLSSGLSPANSVVRSLKQEILSDQPLAAFIRRGIKIIQTDYSHHRTHFGLFSFPPSHQIGPFI